MACSGCSLSPYFGERARERGERAPEIERDVRLLKHLAPLRYPLPGVPGRGSRYGSRRNFALAGASIECRSTPTAARKSIMNRNRLLAIFCLVAVIVCPSPGFGDKAFGLRRMMPRAAAGQ